MAKSKKIEEWQVNSAVDTLIEAQEIMNNKRLLPRVKRAFAEKQRALQEAALELKVSKKQHDIKGR